MRTCVLSTLLCLATAGFCFGQCVGPSQGTSGRHIRTSDGVDLYLEVRGEGTPCLYIHGGPGAGGYWLQKFSGDMLERNFQMIYLDQRGSGRSTSPKDGDYSIARLVEDFEEVRLALGIKQWVTLGHSFGGILQMAYAQRHPQVITGMVMLNCSLDLEESLRGWIPKACELLGITDPKAYTDEAVPLLDRVGDLVGKLKEKDLFWKLAYASQESEKTMDATFDEVPNFNHDFERAPLTPREYWADYRKAAQEMKMPVLFFYGKTDWRVGPEHYKGVHFPNMMLFGSDVGHVASLENTADLEKAVTAYRKRYRL
ncbi:MAG: alpha/beta hydrolase [Armatimonadota bacterium]